MAYPNTPCASAAVEYTSAAPAPLFTTLNGLPEVPPEFAAVTDVPAVPPSAVLDEPPPLTGVTGVDGVEGAEAPTLFVAVTLNVYATPFVRPETVTGVAVGAVAVNPPGDDFTV